MPDFSAGLMAAALFVSAGLLVAWRVDFLRRLPLPARLGWSYLIGLAWVCGVSFALSFVGFAPLRRATFVGVALAALLPWLAAISWGHRRASAWAATKRAAVPFAGRVVARSCAFIVAAVMAGVLLRAAREPLADWDGRMTWAPAARWICAEQTVHPRVLVEKRWSVSHPTYPLLLPIADCVALSFAERREGVEPFRLLYALHYAALLAVIWGAAWRWAGRRAAWLVTAAIALAPFPAWSADGGAAGAYSDLGLAALFGGGVALLARPRRWSEALTGGLLLAGAALTKNEGLWLAAVGCAVCAPTALRRQRLRRRWLVAAVPVALGVALLHAWSDGIPWRGDESYRVLLMRQDMGGAAAAIGLWVAEAARQTFSVPKWSLLWWTVPVLLVLGWRGWARFRFAPLVLAAGLPLAIGAAAYTLHPRAADLAAVTWSRFLVQALAPAAALLALALRRALRREAS